MRSAEFRWTQVRVGLFVAIAGVLLFAFVTYSGLAGTPFARRTPIVGHFDDVAGLATGSPVEMGGVVVGEIAEVDLPDPATGKVRVELGVEHRAMERLGRSSEAFVAAHSLVGQRFIGLTPRKPDEPPLEAGATIRTRESKELGDLAGDVGKLVVDLRGILGDAQRVTKTLADSIEGGEGTLGQLMNDPELYADLKATVANLRALSEQAGKGDGAVAMLLRDRELARDLKGGVDALSKTAQRVNQGKGVLGRLTNDEKAEAQVARTLARLDLVSSRLTEANGTLGALINDRATVERLNGLLQQVDALVADVRRNPRRYLKLDAL